jgi:hypothetical protein
MTELPLATLRLCRGLASPMLSPARHWLKPLMLYICPVFAPGFDLRRFAPQPQGLCLSRIKMPLSAKTAQIDAQSGESPTLERGIDDNYQFETRGHHLHKFGSPLRTMPIVHSRVAKTTALLDSRPFGFVGHERKIINIVVTARARGRIGGYLPMSSDDPRIQTAKKLHADRNIGIADICKTLQISRPTLYRWLSLKFTAC